MMASRVTTGALVVMTMGIVAICYNLYVIYKVRDEGFRSRIDKSGEILPRYRWVSPQEEPDLIRRYTLGVCAPIAGGAFVFGFGLWMLISPTTLLGLLGVKYP